ncbi:MAG: GNAT family N-acetyltransferase [Hyphomicrobiaceae bacterium]
MSAAARLVNRSSIAPAVTSRRAPAKRDTIRPYRSDLAIDIIHDIETFLALEHDWNDLLDGAGKNRLAFQSFAWVRSWLTAYLPNTNYQSQTVAIVTARLNGRLRLICPFTVKNVFGINCLTWLGEPASQYGDIIKGGDEPAPEMIAATIGFAIEQLQPDIVHLRKVREDAAILPWLEAQNAAQTAVDEAPFLDFRDATSFNGYCAKYSAKSRRNRRRLRRRLEEAGAVSTTVLSAGAAAREAVRIGLTFKQAWLIERGLVSSALRDPYMPGFLEHFVGHADDRAAPFVSVMRCGETPVSVQFGIVAKQRLALHMIAYNPKTEKSGAGVLHIEDTIAHCIEHGLTELDFLAPNAPYKQAWADGAVPIGDYVSARTLKGRVYAQAYLCSTRDVLKTRVQALPLGIRQSIAKRIQKPL